LCETISLLIGCRNPTSVSKVSTGVKAWLFIYLYLPVSDYEFDVESYEERQDGADQSRLELRQDEGVDERVGAVPEQQHQRREQEVVEDGVDDRELGSRLHRRRRRVVASADRRACDSARTESASSSSSYSFMRGCHMQPMKDTSEHGNGKV